MAKKVVLVLCAFLALSSARPRDLVDEAQEQLQELMTLVQGDILVAHGDLTDLASDFQYHTVNIYENGLLDLKQGRENIDSQISALVNLALSAGYDVSSCTNIREEALDRLYDQYSNAIGVCTRDANQESETVLSNAKYIVDVLINKVHDLSNQLRNCREDILCISPVLTEIQLNKVRLPQNIQTEVQAAENLVDLLKLSAESCSKTSISEYVSRTNSLLHDITLCINSIVG